MGIAERVPHMQEELGRLRAKMVELAREFGTMREGSVHKSDFRSMVGRHGVEIAGLRQARLDTPPPTLSRGPAEGSRASVPVYFGDRNKLPYFSSSFKRGLWRMTRKTP